MPGWVTVGNTGAGSVTGQGQASGPSNHLHNQQQMYGDHQAGSAARNASGGDVGGDQLGGGAQFGGQNNSALHPGTGQNGQFQISSLPSCDPNAPWDANFSAPTAQMNTGNDIAGTSSNVASNGNLGVQSGLGQGSAVGVTNKPSQYGILSAPQNRPASAPIPGYNQDMANASNTSQPVRNPSGSIGVTLARGLSGSITPQPSGLGIRNVSLQGNDADTASLRRSISDTHPSATVHDGILSNLQAQAAKSARGNSISQSVPPRAKSSTPTINLSDVVPDIYSDLLPTNNARRSVEAQAQEPPSAPNAAQNSSNPDSVATPNMAAGNGTGNPSGVGPAGPTMNHPQTPMLYTIQPYQATSSGITGTSNEPIDLTGSGSTNTPSSDPAQRPATRLRQLSPSPEVDAMPTVPVIDSTTVNNAIGSNNQLGNPAQPSAFPTNAAQFGLPSASGRQAGALYPVNTSGDFAIPAQPRQTSSSQPVRQPILFTFDGINAVASSSTATGKAGQSDLQRRHSDSLAQQAIFDSNPNSHQGPSGQPPQGTMPAQMRVNPHTQMQQAASGGNHPHGMPNSQAVHAGQLAQHTAQLQYQLHMQLKHNAEFLAQQQATAAPSQISPINPSSGQVQHYQQHPSLSAPAQISPVHQQPAQLPQQHQRRSNAGPSHAPAGQSGTEQANHQQMVQFQQQQQQLQATRQGGVMHTIASGSQHESPAAGEPVVLSAYASSWLAGDLQIMIDRESRMAQTHWDMQRLHTNHIVHRAKLEIDARVKEVGELRRQVAQMLEREKANQANYAKNETRYSQARDIVKSLQAQLNERDKDKQSATASSNDLARALEMATVNHNSEIEKLKTDHARELESRDAASEKKWRIHYATVSKSDEVKAVEAKYKVQREKINQKMVEIQAEKDNDALVILNLRSELDTSSSLLKTERAAAKVKAKEAEEKIKRVADDLVARQESTGKPSTVAIDRLQERFKQAVAVAKLKAEVAKLQAELKERNEEALARAAELRRANAASEEMSRKVDEAKKELERLTHELEVACNKEKESSTLVETTRSNLEEVRGSLRTAEEALKDKGNEIQVLSEQLEVSGMFKEDAEEATREKNELHRQIDDLRDEVENLTATRRREELSRDRAPLRKSVPPSTQVHLTTDKTTTTTSSTDITTGPLTPDSAAFGEDEPTSPESVSHSASAPSPSRPVYTYYQPGSSRSPSASVRPEALQSTSYDNNANRSDADNGSEMVVEPNTSTIGLGLDITTSTTTFSASAAAPAAAPVRTRPTYTTFAISAAPKAPAAALTAATPTTLVPQPPPVSAILAMVDSVPMMKTLSSSSSRAGDAPTRPALSRVNSGASANGRSGSVPRTASPAIGNGPASLRLPLPAPFDKSPVATTTPTLPSTAQLGAVNLSERRSQGTLAAPVGQKRTASRSPPREAGDQDLELSPIIPSVKRRKKANRVVDSVSPSPSPAIMSAHPVPVPTAPVRTTVPSAHYQPRQVVKPPKAVAPPSIPIPSAPAPKPTALDKTAFRNWVRSQSDNLTGVHRDGISRVCKVCLNETSDEAERNRIRLQDREPLPSHSPEAVLAHLMGHERILQRVWKDKQQKAK